MHHLLAATALGLVFLSPALAQDDPDLAAREAAVPENPLKEAYFGETHLHTTYSLDALSAATASRPEDAYRFAKGEAMTINGQQHKSSSRSISPRSPTTPSSSAKCTRPRSPARRATTIRNLSSCAA